MKIEIFCTDYSLNDLYICWGWPCKTETCSLNNENNWMKYVQQWGNSHTYESCINKTEKGQLSNCRLKFSVVFLSLLRQILAYYHKIVHFVLCVCMCTGKPQGHHGAGDGYRDTSRSLVAAVHHGALQDHHEIQDCVPHFPDARVTCPLHGKTRTSPNVVVDPEIRTKTLNEKQLCALP